MCGTRLRDAAPHWWPGTARSRENAKIIRDADVIDAVRQKNWAMTAMKSRTSAQLWPIDVGPDRRDDVPRAATAPSVSGIANVTATRRMHPKITDTTTDMSMPTAAERDACVGLLGHVRRRVVAGHRVLRHEQAQPEDVPEHDARTCGGRAEARSC